jgi:tRNA G10  N-methylase Trm11
MGSGKEGGKLGQKIHLTQSHLNCELNWLHTKLSRKSSNHSFTIVTFDPLHRVESYIPAVCSYHLSDLLTDLLDFAARFLVLGGRLVYWLPVIRDE